jgi:hypothetical protein
MFTYEGYCCTCHKRTYHTNDRCDECDARKEKEAEIARSIARVEHFKRLDQQSFEDRLRELEKVVFDMMHKPANGGCNFCPMEPIG